MFLAAASWNAVIHLSIWLDKRWSNAWRVFATNRLLETPGRAADRALAKLASGAVGGFDGWHIVAHRSVKERQPRSAFEILSQMLRTDDVNRHGVAAMLLGDINLPGVPALLCEVLKRPHRPTSFLAAGSLVSLNARDCAPALLEWAAVWQPAGPEDVKRHAEIYLKVASWLAAQAVAGALAVENVLEQVRRGYAPTASLFTLLLVSLKADSEPTGRNQQLLESLEQTEDPFCLLHESELTALAAIDTPFALHCQKRLLLFCAKRDASPRNPGRMRFDSDSVISRLFELDPESALSFARELASRDAEAASMADNELPAATWLANHGDSQVVPYLMRALKGARRNPWAASSALRCLAVLGVRDIGATVAVVLVDSIQRGSSHEHLIQPCANFLLQFGGFEEIDQASLEGIADLPDLTSMYRTPTTSYIEYVPGIGDVTRTSSDFDVVRTSNEPVRSAARAEIARRRAPS